MTNFKQAMKQVGAGSFEVIPGDMPGMDGYDHVITYKKKPIGSVIATPRVIKEVITELNENELLVLSWLGIRGWTSLFNEMLKPKIESRINRKE